MLFLHLFVFIFFSLLVGFAIGFAAYMYYLLFCHEDA